MFLNAQERDYNKKFLLAAYEYYALSNLQNQSDEEIRDFLNKAIKCTILEGSGVEIH